MNLKKNHYSRRALALLLTLVMCVGMIPTAFAAQQNSYHDPAEHWMQASGRTNELDANSVVTRETFKCGECGKATSFEVFRVPEYSPVIINEDMVIVDGHNRQALCEKHGLPYTMAVFSFEDLLEAKQWALDTQKGRRNLEKWELGKIALKLKPEIEAKARANQSAAGGDKSDISCCAVRPKSAG